MDNEQKDMYPVKFNIEVLITNGEEVGKVTYGSNFQRPTHPRMLEVLKECEEAAKEHGYRVMTRQEAVGYVLAELTGGVNLSIPSAGKDETWYGVQDNG